MSCSQDLRVLNLLTKHSHISHLFHILCNISHNIHSHRIQHSGHRLACNQILSSPTYESIPSKFGYPSPMSCSQDLRVLNLLTKHSHSFHFFHSLCSTLGNIHHHHIWHNCHQQVGIFHFSLPTYENIPSKFGSSNPMFCSQDQLVLDH